MLKSVLPLTFLLDCTETASLGLSPCLAYVSFKSYSKPEGFVFVVF